MLLLCCSMSVVNAGLWNSKPASGTTSISSNTDANLIGKEGSKNSGSRDTISPDEEGSINRNAMSFPILHNLKYTVPYSFEECVGDLKHILSMLLGDTDLEIHDANNKESCKAKEKTKDRSNYANGKFEYKLGEFASQAIELCSPESYNTIFDNLQNELSSGKYPKNCLLVLDSPGTKKKATVDPNIDCFQLMIRIEQQLKNRNLLKEKLMAKNGSKVKADPKQVRLQNIQGPSLPKNERLKEGDNFNNDGVDRLFLSSYRQSDEEFVNQGGKPTSTESADLINTIHKTTIKPMVVRSTVTKTEIGKSIGTVTTTKIETTVAYSTNSVKKVTPVTNLQLEASVSTQPVGKKTFYRKEAVTKTETEKNPYMTNYPASENGKGNELIHAEYFPGRRRATIETVIETTITSTIITASQLRLVSKICRVVGRFGISCPPSPSAPSAGATKTTTTTKTETTLTTSTSSETKTTTTTSTNIKTKTSTTISTNTKTKTTTTTSTSAKTKTTITTSTTTETTSTTKTKTKSYETDCDDDHPDYPHQHPLPPVDDEDCDEDVDDDDFYYFKDSHDYVEKYAMKQDISNGVVTSNYHPAESRFNSTSLKNTDHSSLNHNGSFNQFGNRSSTYESMENNSTQLLSSILLSAFLTLMVLGTV